MRWVEMRWGGVGEVGQSVLYCTVLYCTVLYCTVLYTTLTQLRLHLQILYCQTARAPVCLVSWIEKLCERHFIQQMFRFAIW